MNTLREIKNELKSISNPKQAKLLSGFFKTGKGEYGEGDIFYGIKVPVVRNIIKKYSTKINISDTEKLLHSKIHEERLCALLILVDKFENKKATESEKSEIFKTYLANTNWINNWDLVDLSAPRIFGNYLYNHSEKQELFEKLAKSDLLWERRISILGTFYFIKNKDFHHTLNVSELLLKDKQDLMHKAVGWMLREIGKKDSKVEKTFLKKYYKQMPRTMLRYAIERFPEKKRKEYLAGII
jgi:3-methyladenine DNA glycosylase AlkD